MSDTLLRSLVDRLRRQAQPDTVGSDGELLRRWADSPSAPFAAAGAGSPSASGAPASVTSLGRCSGGRRSFFRCRRGGWRTLAAPRLGLGGVHGRAPAGDAHARRGEVTDHLPQGGVLAAHARHVVHPQRIEPDYVVVQRYPLRWLVLGRR